MTGRERDDICAACQLGECQHCEGNHDLHGGGRGPAVPLSRCAHACPRALKRPDKPWPKDSTADRY